MGYDGHNQGNPATVHETSALTAERLANAQRAVEAAGVAVRLVSGAGSGNYFAAVQQGTMTEIQAGGAVPFCNAYRSERTLARELA